MKKMSVTMLQNVHEKESKSQNKLKYNPIMVSYLNNFFSLPAELTREMDRGVCLSRKAGPARFHRTTFARSRWKNL